MKWKNIAGFVVGIPVAVLAIMQIYVMATAPSADLTGIAKYDDFVWPGNVIPEYRMLIDRFDADSLKANIDLPSILPKTMEAELKSDFEKLFFLTVELYANQRLSWMRSELYFSIDGYWSLELRNGESQVDDVEIFFPGAVLAQYNREGGIPIIDTINELVQLGRMRPGEKVTILAWTHYLSLSFRVKDIRITHKGGLGKVRTLERVGAFGQFCDRHGRFIIYFTLAAVIWGSLMWYSLGRNGGAKSASRNSERTPGPENKTTDNTP